MPTDSDDPDTVSMPLPDLQYIEPAIPPGVSDDIRFLAIQQAQQHFDRRVDSRTMAARIEAGDRHTHKRLDRIEATLEDKPGKEIVRPLMVFSAGVFLVLLFAVFQLRGINSAEAINNTRDMLGVSGVSAPASPSPESTP